MSHELKQYSMLSILLVYKMGLVFVFRELKSVRRMWGIKIYYWRQIMIWATRNMQSNVWIKPDRLYNSCQLMVIGTNLTPIGIFNLEWGEEGNYSLKNSSIVVQHFCETALDWWPSGEIPLWLDSSAPQCPVLVCFVLPSCALLCSAETSMCQLS